MDINQFNCFISVAQTLNFSEAARRNFVSQSTVSRYISDLEKEFGVQLFVRSHRDVILTNEGKALLPYAIEIVDTLKKAKTTIKQMHNGGRGRISIGCDITSVAFPAKCIEDFKDKYPDIVVEIKQFDTSDRNQYVADGEFDFCFMPRDMVPESSDIEVFVTHTDMLIAMASHKKFGKNKRCITLREIANEKLLLLSESVSPIVYMEIMDLFRTFHISPDSDNSYDDMLSLYIAVTSGMGISIIPQSLAGCVSDDLCRIYPIEDADTGIPYVMAWEKKNANPAAKLFVKSVKKFSMGEDKGYGL